MQHFKTLTCAFIIALCSFYSCQLKKDVEKNSEKDSKTIKVGAMAGPEADLVKAASALAKEKYDLQIDVVEFNDYVSPNAALADKSIDLNAFQTVPYLDETIKAKGYDLVNVANTFLYPIGVYSKKYKSIEALPNKAKIAIPNDPSNEARALMILQQANLIQLKDGAGLLATVGDVVHNPKQLNFVTLDAAQLPRVIQDVDCAVINTNYAKPAGLEHGKDTIFVETTDSLYMNIIVARKDNSNDPKVQNFIKAYQSEAVKQKAKELFGLTAVAGF